ncbi:MAG: DUF1275 domain-containing protein [Oligoflexia bacterium]|nr:DUF1275 domain-containing protein [Oligoflexia bacterium]
MKRERLIENPWLWCLMAFQAGAINAGGFIACGRFITHVTGFATHFGFDLATKDYYTAFSMILVPLFFLLGAMYSSYFVSLKIKNALKPNYWIPTFTIFLILSLGTLLGNLNKLGEFSTDFNPKNDFLLVALLCLASGVQNALIVNSRGILVRTTHLTGITTDLAESIISSLFLKNKDERGAQRVNSIYRIGIILFFIFGSVTSSIIFLEYEYLGFLLPTISSFWVFLLFLI